MIAIGYDLVCETCSDYQVRRTPADYVSWVAAAYTKPSLAEPAPSLSPHTPCSKCLHNTYTALRSFISTAPDEDHRNQDAVVPRTLGPFNPQGPILVVQTLGFWSQTGFHKP